MTLEKWQLQQRNFTEEERRKRSDASAYLHSYREKNVPIGTNKTPSRRTEFPPGPDEQAQIGSSTDIKGIVAEFEKSISVTTPTSEPIHNSSGNPLAEKIAPQDNSLPYSSESQPETLMVNNNLNSTNAAVALTEETPQTEFSKALQAEEVITTEEYSMTTAQLVDDNLYQENESKPQPDSTPMVNEEPDVNAELTQTFTQKELEPASIEAEPHQSYLQTDPSTTSPVETEGLLSVREREPQYDDPHLTTTNSPVEATECPLESQVDPQADATSSPVQTTDVYSPEEPQMNLQPEATSSPVKPTESYLPVEPQIAPILELPRKQVDVKVLLAVHVKQTDADAILVGGQQSILDSVIWVTENIVKNTIATSACLDATGTIYDSKFPPTITSVEADNGTLDVIYLLDRAHSIFCSSCLSQYYW